MTNYLTSNILITNSVLQTISLFIKHLSIEFCNNNNNNITPDSHPWPPSRVRFTLVSEPDDNKGECQDIGQAFVSVHDVLEKGADIIDRDMPGGCLCNGDRWALM